MAAVKPHPSAAYWEVDGVAECLDVSMGTSASLWLFVPQVGSAPTVKAVWSKLTEAEQVEINAAFERQAASWGVAAFEEAS